MYSTIISDGAQDKLRGIRKKVCAQMRRLPSGSADRNALAKELRIVEGLLALEERSRAVAAMIRRVASAA